MARPRVADGGGASTSTLPYHRQVTATAKVIDLEVSSGEMERSLRIFVTDKHSSRLEQGREAQGSS